MESFVYVRDGDGFLTTTTPTIQEVRFAKAMLYVLKKLQRTVRDRGSSFDTSIFGLIVYQESRKGKVWYGRLRFNEAELSYLEMRHAVSWALFKLTGELVALSVSFDRTECEFRFMDGRPLSEKV